MRLAAAGFMAAVLLAAPALAAGHDKTLRAALENLDKTENMTPAAARQVQTEMDLYLRDTLGKLGELKSLYAMGSFAADPPLIYAGKTRKLEQFQATYAHGWIQWRVFVQPDGKIARLAPFSINAPGTD